MIGHEFGDESRARLVKAVMDYVENPQKRYELNVFIMEIQAPLIEALRVIQESNKALLQRVKQLEKDNEIRTH